MPAAAPIGRVTPTRPPGGIPSPGTVGSEVDNSLPATDILSFEQQRGSARSSAARALSQNAFDRGVLNLQNRRSIRSTNRSFGFAREAVPETFARRGLLRSGLQQRQAGRLAEDQQLQLNELAFRLQQDLGLLDLQDQGIESALAEAIGNIDATELLRRTTLAAEV